VLNVDNLDVVITLFVRYFLNKEQVEKSS